MLKKILDWRVSRVWLMTAWCLSFVAGIGAVQTGLWLQGWFWLLPAVVVLLACRDKLLIIALPAVVCSGAMFGLWRGTELAANIADYGKFIGQKVQLTGIITEDPTYTADSQQDMLLTNVQINGLPMPGQVRIKTMSFVDPKRGDHIAASGKLYDGFGPYQAAVYYAGVQMLAVAEDPIDIIRRQFAARVYNVLPDTQAGLGLGFLLGIKSGLPDDLSDDMKALGLTHIVVASGYNLTILVRLSRRLLQRSSHYQTTVVSLALIAGFVTATGFSPSMSRAALVSSLCVIAWYYGRRVHPALLIAFAAAVTAMINPLYVWSDLGWWLSFLAFAGVMLLAPLVQKRVFAARQPKLFGQIIIETVCAQLVTLPLILCIFGELAVLSLPANILVVPLIPLAMLLTFFAGLAGPIFPYIAWPAIWLLGYLCQLVQLLGQIPWALVDVKIPWPVMVAVYTGVIATGLVVWRKTKHDYLSQSVID